MDHLHRNLAGPADAERLARRLWPGGPDRTVPVARGWIALWGPARAGAELPPCACPDRCSICN